MPPDTDCDHELSNDPCLMIVACRKCHQRFEHFLHWDPERKWFFGAYRPLVVPE